MPQLKIDFSWELKNHPLFGSLSSDEINILVDISKLQVISPGGTIFSTGDESHSLYIVLDGRVKVSVFSRRGKETILAFVGKNDVLGEMGMFENSVRSASAIAITKSRLLAINKIELLNFLTKNPQVSLRFIASLSQRLRQTNLLLEELTTQSGESRLAGRLLWLAASCGKRDDEGDIFINFKLTQSNLGNHTSLVRENVNRYLKAWEESGILESRKGVIHLRNIDKLRMISGDI